MAKKFQKESILGYWLREFELRRASTLQRKDVRANYSRTLDRLRQFFPEKKHPAEFLPGDFRDYRILRERKGISAATIRLELTILRAFFSWLLELGVIELHPLTASILPEVRYVHRTDAVGVLSPEHFQAMLSACSTPQERLLVLLPATTGVQPTELEGLTKGDIDFQTSQLQIPAELSRTKTARLLPLREDVMRALALHVQPDAGDGESLIGLQRDAILIRTKKIALRAGLEEFHHKTLSGMFLQALYRGGIAPELIRFLTGVEMRGSPVRYLERAGIDKLPLVVDSIGQLPSPARHL